jgi:cytochrome c556
MFVIKHEIRRDAFRVDQIARFFRAPALIAPLLLGCCTLSATPARADDEDVIDYREHIMKTMDEQAAAIGQIMQQKAPAENLAIHIQILASAAATAKKAFEPKVPGGQAKPDIWVNWPDFAKRLDELKAATAELATSAKDHGLSVTASKIQAALSCKSCHDTYRTEKTK